jgi:hypothetical protein
LIFITKPDGDALTSTFNLAFASLSPRKPGMKLDKRIEEAVPAGQQLQELGMRLRCLDDGSSDQVSFQVRAATQEKKKMLSTNPDDRVYPHETKLNSILARFAG